MGQLSLILALGALLIGGIVLLNVQDTAAGADDAAAAYQVDRFAREAALIGLEQAERKLNDDPDGWAVFPLDPDSARALFEVPLTPMNGATYAVVLDTILIGSGPSDPDEAWVTATATYTGWDPGQGADGTTVYTAVAKYEKGYTDIGVPPGMRFAIVTNRDLDIRGNAVISGSVHANGALSTHGGSFDVLGTGTYTNGTGESYDETQFTGGVSVQDSIHIPIVDIPPASYHHNTGGDFTLDPSTDPTGTLPQGWYGVSGMGTEQDPYVFYVDGNLIINGDVRLLGHCRLYVNGTVGFGGNAQLSPVTATPPNVNNASNQDIQNWIDTNLPGGSTLGIYANGQITLDGTVFVAAHLYTYDAVRYTGGGNKLVIGGILAHGALDVRGNAKIFYTDPNASIIPGANDQVPEGLRLIAYREWAQRPSDPTP